MPTPVVAESGSEGAQWDRSGAKYTRRFTVVAESVSSAKTLLQGAKGVYIGAVFQNHQGEEPDPWAVCHAIQGKPLVEAPVGRTGLYELTASYGWPTFRDERPIVDPDDQPRLWVEHGEITEPVDHDRFGNPIANTAQELIDPPLTRHRVLRTLCVQWVVRAANYPAAYNQFSDYMETLNSTSFKGIPKGSLLCRVIDVEDLNRDGVLTDVFRVTAKLDWRKPRQIGGEWYEGWHDVVLNEGRRELAGTSGGVPQYQSNLGKDGQALAKPVPLGLNGKRLPAGLDVPRLCFEHYDYRDFNAWGV